MSPPAGFVTRFAPSPTGRLHRGHAFSALTAHDAARAAGGRLNLRIEDIDTARCRPAFAQAIIADLAWLGVTWDEPVVFQSKRQVAYAGALRALRDRGLVYRCFKTRAEAAAASASAPHGPQLAFLGAALPLDEEAGRLAAGEAFAWRLSIAAAERALDGFANLAFQDADRGRIRADPWLAGDVILARKDLGVAYHLAAVVDDGASGVTCVIRGEDLREACHVQVLLQALLRLPTPDYRHHPLILGADGKRLAKRDASETIASLRAGGATPERLRAELGL